MGSESELQIFEEWQALHENIIQRGLSIHLVIGSYGAYPANMLRNVAIDALRRDKVFAADPWFYAVLDCDAMPCASEKSFAADLAHAIERKGRNANVVFVIPSFESNGNHPATKDELREHFKMGRVSEMHPGRRSYSGPLKHRIWIESDAPYEIEYEAMFEPYFIASLNHSIRFDEGFVGRGFNKQSHHFELWAAGFDYFVLANSFALNIKHQDAAWDQLESGIQLNKPKWHSFRSAVEKRYDIECKSRYWQMCDERQRMCDRVCWRGHRAGSHKASVKRETSEARDKRRADRVAARERDTWNRFTSELEKRRRSGKALPEIPVSRDACSVVDAVYTWVDGSDPAHRAQARKHIPSKAFEAKVHLGGGKKIRPGHLDFRFRDFGDASTLRYSIRSLRKFAPWIDRIFIVVADGQTPRWLRRGADRIVLVSHSDIFKKCSL